MTTEQDDALAGVERIIRSKQQAIQHNESLIETLEAEIGELEAILERAIDNAMAGD